MKKLAGVLLSMAAFGVVAGFTVANDEDKPGTGDRPRDGQRNGDRGREGRGRGPRDGDGPRERGPRDGERRGPGGNPLMAALDANKDGVIDAGEIKNGVAALQKLGRNEEGKLTAEEIGGRPPREGDRPPGDRPQRGEGRPSPEQMIARFNEADKNEDGKLSKEEAPDRMKEGFDRVDTDGNGFIEKAEFETLIKRMRDGGGRPPGAGRGREGDRPRGERSRPREGDGGGKRERPEEE